MATIAENLQIIKDSTDAIKQAIIDKGGDVSGDISTWAEAITGISGGGNDDTKPEIAVFSFCNKGKYVYEVGMTWDEWINSEYGKMQMEHNHGMISSGNDNIVHVFVYPIGLCNLRIEGNDEDIMLSTVINKDIINYTYYTDPDLFD